MSTQQNNISNTLNTEPASTGLAEMCSSFELPDNCQKFKDFPEAYCHTFELTEEQIHAVTDLDILRMLKTGGNTEGIAKLTNIYDLSIQDLAIQQTGKSLADLLSEL